MRLPTIICFLGLLLLLSCEDDAATLASESELVSVSYGTSFGFCLGYCNRDLTITRARIEFVKSGRPDTVQTITCEVSFSGTEWDNLTATIRWPSFVELDTIYGCPDCADGGAEYLELHGPSSSYRITYEYNKEPAEIQSVVAILRSQLQDFEDCGD